jgi:hypothetical protein
MTVRLALPGLVALSAGLLARVEVECIAHVPAERK